MIQLLRLPLSNYRLDHQPDLSHSRWTEESITALIEVDNKRRRRRRRRGGAAELT